MKDSKWKIIEASVAGTLHKARELPCQDAFAVRVFETGAGETLVIAVSDGAGSAKFAETGARFVCDYFISEIGALLENGGKASDLNQDFSHQFPPKLQTALAEEVGNQNLSDYACTFLALAASEDETVFLQIGDGAIVYSTEPDEFRLFTIPQQGEYANSTFFITDESAAENLKFEKIRNGVKELAIFTDGLQRLAIDFQSKQPYQPFFRSMLAPLRLLNSAENLEKKLSEFLDSPKINERTDDDKTLILASSGNA